MKMNFILCIPIYLVSSVNVGKLCVGNFYSSTVYDKIDIWLIDFGLACWGIAFLLG